MIAIRSKPYHITLHLNTIPTHLVDSLKLRGYAPNLTQCLTRETFMSLSDRLTEDLKLAMKSRDQLRMDVIRMIKAAVLNKEVELKRDLDDAEMSRVMTTLVKQRRESVEQFEKAQRTELAAKERKEIEIIESYLPKPLSPQELEAIVVSAVSETGSRSLKDMGTVMKAVMARLAGQSIDGKQVSDLVKSKLT